MYFLLKKLEINWKLHFFLTALIPISNQTLYHRSQLLCSIIVCRNYFSQLEHFFKKIHLFLFQHIFPSSNFLLASPSLSSLYETPHFIDTDVGKLLMVWPMCEGRDANVSIKDGFLSFEVQLSPLAYDIKSLHFLSLYLFYLSFVVKMPNVTLSAVIVLMAL